MDYYPVSRPRKVDGGLKARSARGTIGESWWSQRFIAVLESFALGSRLTRGKAYARAGQVLTLAVAPGTVTASVQGSRPKPYRVRIGLAPFPSLVWAKVEVALAEQALYCAKLLAGEMPAQIEEVFAAAGAPLFPGRVGQLDLSCSCPDFALPCKHLAAAFYLLAEAFDTDPFQLLAWRGRDRESLLHRLRELRAGAGSRTGERGTAKVRTATEPVSGAALALADLPSPALAEVVDRFWVAPVPLPGPPAVLDTEPDLLLRQLPGPPRSLGGADLDDALRGHYRRFARP